MNPKQDHHVKELQMKEEKGKILLQPSFKQQQQQKQHIKNNKLNNNMTNKHKQQQQRRTSTMAGLPYQPTSQDLKRTINPEEEEQHQHLSTTHPILKKK